MARSGLPGREPWTGNPSIAHGAQYGLENTIAWTDCKTLVLSYHRHLPEVAVSRLFVVAENRTRPPWCTPSRCAIARSTAPLASETPTLNRSFTLLLLLVPHISFGL